MEALFPLGELGQLELRVPPEGSKWREDREEGCVLSPSTTWLTSLHWTGLLGHVRAWLGGLSPRAEIFVLAGEAVLRALC